MIIINKIIKYCNIVMIKKKTIKTDWYGNLNKNYNNAFLEELL
jgi:hypothetical protein